MTRLFSPLAILMAILTSACSTENPLCTENYCVTGEVFARAELGDREFEQLPGRVSEEEILLLFSVPTAGDFETIEVTGKVDWDFLSDDWTYREDRVTYLKKLTLELEGDDGKFGQNRILLVHLNKHTVHRDQNFVGHVDFLGTETLRLTEHIGIATFKGDVVGAPTK